MYRLVIIFFIFILFNDSLHGQTDLSVQRLDSLKHYTYKDLSKKFYDNETDSVIAVVYANAYLNRAKEDRDTIKIANGYFFMTVPNKDSVAIQYADSIINLTKNIKEDKFYPVYGYFTKANLLYKNRRFKDALDNYLECNNHLEQWKGLELPYVIKHDIGLLKSRMGEYDEALNIFKECLSFCIEKDNKKTYNNFYLITLFALSDTYMRKQLLDSASMYNRIGYNESNVNENNKMKHYFILNEGANQCFKKNYHAAIDSITKAMPIIEKADDLPNIAYSYFYLGKSCYELKKLEKALLYFKEVDTIFQKISDIHPEMREGYEMLIDHYRSVGDKEQQLLYTQKLLTVDSILNDNYKYISKNIIHQYDTPRLILEKDELIAALDSEKNRITIGIIGISVLALGITGLFFYSYRKQRIYRERLKKLLQEKPRQKAIQAENEIKETISNSEIPEEVAKAILKNLKQFESEHGYLSRDLNLKDMAKGLKTNSKYLSKTINLYKEKSFSSYINDLRVDYAVSRLKTDGKFRNYTITAIARETGFNSSEPFSKAFYKRTGIYPSFLIKELNKRG